MLPQARKTSSVLNLGILLLGVSKHDENVQLCSWLTFPRFSRKKFKSEWKASIFKNMLTLILWLFFNKLRQILQDLFYCCLRKFSQPLFSQRYIDDDRSLHTLSFLFGSPRRNHPKPKKKSRQSKSNIKVLLTVFFDFYSVFHKDLLPTGQTVRL